MSCTENLPTAHYQLTMNIASPNNVKYFKATRSRHFVYSKAAMSNPRPSLGFRCSNCILFADSLSLFW